MTLTRAHDRGVVLVLTMKQKASCRVQGNLHQHCCSLDASILGIIVAKHYGFTCWRTCACDYCGFAVERGLSDCHVKSRNLLYCCVCRSRGLWINLLSGSRPPDVRQPWRIDTPASEARSIRSLDGSKKSKQRICSPFRWSTNRPVQ